MSLRYYIFVLLFFAVKFVSLQAFDKNAGNWNNDVLFLYKTKNANYWICRDKIVYDSYKIVKHSEDSLKIEGFSSSISFENINDNYAIHQIESKNKNANFRETCDTLIFEDFYNEIDLRLYHKNEVLAFDFLCNIHSNPNDISISIPEDYSITNSGSKINLIENESGFALILDSLNTYTNYNTSIASNFYLDSKKIKINTEANKYDSYVIDPIVFSTFLGGSSYEYARDVVSNQQSIYVVGYSASKNFPIKEGAYTEYIKESEAGEIDIIVSRFNRNGSELLSSTYFGSYFNDYAEAICLDSNSNVYITGYFVSNSTFPYTLNGIDTTLEAGYEGFVACFDSSLSVLRYCTLISGESDDFPQNIYYNHQTRSIDVAGYTYSKETFPISDTKHINYKSEKADGFYLSLSPDLSKINSSIIWGGKDDDFCHDFAFDSNKIIAIGYSLSNDYPLLSEDATYLQKRDSINGDAYISKFDKTNLRLEKSIILSGIKKDIAYTISSFNDTTFSIAGYTESIDFPVTSNAYDNIYSNGISLSKGDAFVTKINNDLVPKYISYYGGGETDRAFDCGHDSKGNTYIIGSTYSIDLPIKGPFINDSFADTSSNSDAFVAKISSDGQNLLYSTYLGGSKIDIARALFVEKSDYTIVTGWTSSADFPVSEAAFDTTHNNNNLADIFLFKFLPSRIEFDKGNLLTLCNVDTIEISTELYDFDEIDTLYWMPDYNISSIYSLNTVLYPDSSTIYTLFVRDTTGFLDSASIDIRIIEFPDKMISGPTKVKPDIEYQYSAEYKELISYHWVVNAGEVIEGNDSNSVTIKWTNPDEGSIQVFYNTDFGCRDSSNIVYTVYDTIIKPHIKPITKTKVCKGQPVIFDAGAGYKVYQWSTGSTARFDTVFSAGLYWAVLKDYDNVIHFTDTVFVTLLPLPQIPSIVAESNKLTSTEEDLGYQWYLDGLPIENTNSKTYFAKESGYYQVELINKNDCKNKSDSLYVTVSSVIDVGKDFEYYIYNEILEFRAEYDCDIVIYDITGRQVLSKYFARSTNIDLHNLSGGVYYVEIKPLTKAMTYPHVFKFIKY